jgi:hypothetical protein
VFGLFPLVSETIFFPPCIQASSILEYFKSTVTYTRTSQTLDYFFKRNPSRKASVDLKYSRIELACIHGGKKIVSETSGKRPNTRYSSRKW